MTRESQNSLTLETLGSGVRTDSHPEMEDALRALQQQVSALTSQNAALEALLPGQQHIAQGLCRVAWSNQDCAESFTSTNEKDAC